MSIYYYSRKSIEDFDITKGLKIMGVEDKILTDEELKDQNKEELYKDCITFESETPLLGYPILEDGTLRSATRIELVNMGIQTLEDGEYIEGEEIKKAKKPNYYAVWNKEINKWETDVKALEDGYILNENQEIDFISAPSDLIKPVWDKENFKWIEGASEIEKVLFKADRYKMLDTPLNFEEMEEAGVLEDYKKFMKECKAYLQQKKVMTLGDTEPEIYIPEPSLNLESFFNNFRNIFNF